MKKKQTGSRSDAARYAALAGVAAIVIAVFALGFVFASGLGAK